MCYDYNSGDAGVLRMHTEGTLDENLSALIELSWEDYHEKTDAVEALVRPLFYQRDLTSEEKRMVCEFVSLIGNKDIKLLQSEHNDNKSDPRKRRFTTTFNGHVENDKWPANYQRDMTPLGQKCVKSLKDYLQTSNDVLQCSKRAAMFTLAWRGLDQQRRNSSGWRLSNTMIGGHCDDSWYDVDKEGRPQNFTTRAVFFFGVPFILILDMKLVWAVPTGEVWKNGKLKYKQRQKHVGKCKIAIDSSLGVYFLTHIISGREPGWKMRDPDDDIMKAVVFFHSTEADVGSSGLTSRGIFNHDRTFSTREENDQYFNFVSLGFYTTPFPSIMPPTFQHLTQFGDHSDTTSVVAEIDRILNEANMHMRKSNEEKKQAAEDALLDIELMSGQLEPDRVKLASSKEQDAEVFAPWLENRKRKWRLERGERKAADGQLEAKNGPRTKPSGNRRRGHRIPRRRGQAPSKKRKAPAEVDENAKPTKKKKRINPAEDSTPAASAQPTASKEERRDVVRMFDASAEGKERKSLNAKQTSSNRVMAEQDTADLAQLESQRALLTLARDEAKREKKSNEDIAAAARAITDWDKSTDGKKRKNLKTKEWHCQLTMTEEDVARLAELNTKRASFSKMSKEELVSSKSQIQAAIAAIAAAVSEGEAKKAAANEAKRKKLEEKEQRLVAAAVSEGEAKKAAANEAKRKRLEEKERLEEEAKNATGLVKQYCIPLTADHGGVGISVAKANAVVNLILVHGRRWVKIASILNETDDFDGVYDYQLQNYCDSVLAKIPSLKDDINAATVRPDTIVVQHDSGIKGTYRRHQECTPDSVPCYYKRGAAWNNDAVDIMIYRQSRTWYICIPQEKKLLFKSDVGSGLPPKGNWIADEKGDGSTIQLAYPACKRNQKYFL